MEAVPPAEPFLPFKFQVDEALDNCPEYEMLAHHFTILVGRLTEGTIKINQRVLVPVSGGELHASYIVLLANHHKMIDEISASDAGALEIALWGCSVRYDEIEPGAIVEWCNAIPKVDLARRLRAHPSLFLHRTTESRSACKLCMSGLFRIPDCSIILTDLTSHSDPDIADIARIALDSFNRL